MRPGRFRVLEFKKKDSTGCLIETFFKYPDYGHFQLLNIFKGCYSTVQYLVSVNENQIYLIMPLREGLDLF